MVGVANFETNNAHHHMSTDETTIYLEMAKFTSTLSRNQRLRFASILSKVDKMHKKNSVSVDNETVQKVLKSKLPTTDAELRNLYLNGKNSIM